MFSDADDLIFPRNPTRVGPRYQATCPPYNSEMQATLSKFSSITVLVNVTCRCVDDELEHRRGTEETIEVLSTLCHLSEEDCQYVIADIDMMSTDFSSLNGTVAVKSGE